MYIVSILYVVQCCNSYSFRWDGQRSSTVSLLLEDGGFMCATWLIHSPWNDVEILQTCLRCTRSPFLDSNKWSLKPPKRCRKVFPRLQDGSSMIITYIYIHIYIYIVYLSIYIYIYIYIYMGGSWNRGTPKSSILMVLSIINHPFWGTPILRNLHIYLNPLKCSLFQDFSAFWPPPSGCLYMKNHPRNLWLHIFQRICTYTYLYVYVYMCMYIYIYIHMNMSQTCNYVTSYNDHSTIYSVNSVVETIGVNTSEYQRVAWQLFWDIRCSEIIRIRSNKTSPHSECLLVSSV